MCDYDDYDDYDGEPTCQDCGQRDAQRHSTRCYVCNQERQQEQAELPTPPPPASAQQPTE